MPPHGGSSLADTRLATLSCLAADELAELRHCAVTNREVRAGTELVREGEPNDNLFFLAKGWACQSKNVSDGSRHIAALLVPRDICNLDALLFDRVNFGVRMLTAGVVLSVSRERALALSDAHPGVARGFTWFGLVENAMLAQNTLRLGKMNAREKLAHLFCELAVRLGFTDDRGWVSFAMPLTQDQLADVLGLTPVHTNRMVQQLRGEGLVEQAQRILTIPDIAALRGVADFDPAYLHVHQPQGGPSLTRRTDDRNAVPRVAQALG